MTTDEIREIGKKEIGWERHRKLTDESSANTVLYHWMLGYTNRLKGEKNDILQLNDYPALNKYDLSDRMKELELPDGMIELIKEYLPLTMTVGTVWGKSKPKEQRDQTDDLHYRCKDLKKKILAYDYYGEIVIIANGTPIVLVLGYDKEYDEKTIEWKESTIINHDFKWNQ